MKFAASFLVFLLLTAGTSLSQVLSSGDIALIGANAVNPDEFAFVALVDIPQGTEIGFVDHGWLASGSFRTNEDELFYTASSTIPMGTVVAIDTDGGAPRFAQAGDQVIAFQGTVESPSFLYALNFEGDGVWQEDATSSNTSALPSGLVNGFTAVAVSECSDNNHKYNGPTSGTKSELLGHIGDKLNWTCSSSRQTFLSSFSVIGGGSNSFPEFTNPILTANVDSGELLQIDYDATDSDQDDLTFSGIGLPSGSSISPDTGILSWTPTEEQVGSNTFTISVSDGTDTASISVTVSVTSIIDAKTPSFVVVPADTLVAANTSLSIPFDVDDPDGLPIASYSVNPSSLGASVDNSTFSWVSSNVPNVYSFTITATDADGLSVSHELFIGVSGVLFEGETSTTLLASLQGAYSPSQTLGYDTARDTMYSKIDLDLDGFVRGIYTGFSVEYTGGDPSTAMFNNGINAEHSWPQSMGASSEPQRSDLHSLFPAKDNVNSTRNNYPYAEIPDSDTQTWFVGSTSQSTIPLIDVDAYSEFASGRFEPRESVKGDIARAVFYFNTIYSTEASQSFFDLQSATLGSWESLDVVSGKEIRRSGKIRKYQGNLNPFLLDSSLDDRLFGTATSIQDEEIPTVFSIDSVYPNPVVGSSEVNIMLRSGQAAKVEISLVDVLGRTVVKHSVPLTSPNETISFDLSNVSRGTYYIRIATANNVDYKSITVL